MYPSSEYTLCRADMDTILVSMAFLKFFKESISFKCDGILSHILGPRYLNFQSHGLQFSNLE